MKQSEINGQASHYFGEIAVRDLAVGNTNRTCRDRETALGESLRTWVSNHLSVRTIESVDDVKRTGCPNVKAPDTGKFKIAVTINPKAAFEVTVNREGIGG